jgi:starch-binding outer membrane protein, SusD/RagB family
MKIFNKRTIAKFSAICLLAAAVGGCQKTEEFFDLEDPSGVGPEMWNDAGAVTLFLDKGYDLIMPQWPVPGAIHNTSDELNSASTALLYGQLTDNSITDIATGNTITTNRYQDIRRCNLAIEGLNGGSIDEVSKSRLKGQFFMLRAMVYFNLVRIYGGVPLVMKVLGPNDNLQIPRSKTSECIEAIVKDLDSAGAMLPATWGSADRGRLTKGAAYAFKSRVLLYWASPQFNPTNQADRWERAYVAARQAYDTCIAGGYALNSTYGTIFTDETNKEAIIVRLHDAVSVSPGRGTNTEYITRPRSETTGQAGGGSNQPTWNLVQAYPMANGLPITHASSGYNSVLFWQNRDPRFAASVSYNGDVWPLSGKTGRKQWNYQSVPDEVGGLTATGFYIKKITNPAILAQNTQYNSNVGGGSGMDWIELRLAEVMLNLAEAANETGRMTEAKDMVRRIRQRAGIAAGSFDFGLGVANTVSEMRDLIMTERQVEFAMEGKRYWDLRRMRRLHLLTGSVRQGLRWDAKAPYRAGTSGGPAGTIYLDAINSLGLKNRDTANLNNQSTYTNMFTTQVISLDATQPINIPTTYYFYALPTGFRNSSFVLEQTIGWPGGSFDPLQ